MQNKVLTLMGFAVEMPAKYTRARTIADVVSFMLDFLLLEMPVEQVLVV